MTHVVATAVAIGGRALMLSGPSGCGKSELALALVKQGAVLIGDDGVTVHHADGQLMAGAPAHHIGRIAIRDIGTVDVPVVDGAVPLALMVVLDPATPPQPLPRLASWGPIAGLYVPQVTLHPGTIAILDKLLLALDRWGL